MSGELAPPSRGPAGLRGGGVLPRLRGFCSLLPVRRGGPGPGSLQRPPPLTGPSAVPCAEADPGRATGFSLQLRPPASHGDLDKAEVSTAPSLILVPFPSAHGLCLSLLGPLCCTSTPLLCLFLSPCPVPAWVVCLPHSLPSSPPHLLHFVDLNLRLSPDPLSRSPHPSPPSLAPASSRRTTSLTPYLCVLSLP